MRRLLTAVAPAVAIAIGLCASGAVAQRSPADTGAGVLRGVQDRNNSGQVGYINLYRRGANTLVVLTIDGAPTTGVEPAHLHRGKSCASADPNPAYPLSPVRGGKSSTIVHAPIARLMSGNYVVNVHSRSNPMHEVACGELTPGS